MFNVWLPRRVRKENEGGGKKVTADLEIPWKSLQQEEEGLATNGRETTTVPACIFGTSEIKAMRAQIFTIWRAR